ncbi:hypothetical protein HanPI659440_Chr17g0689531 [Helianthus annuus]|nr:hypothetical protein HanPI659440_Chr17g0689531 [Helianthus annuus]
MCFEVSVNIIYNNTAGFSEHHKHCRFSGLSLFQNPLLRHTHQASQNTTNIVAFPVKTYYPIYIGGGGELVLVAFITRKTKYISGR